MGQRVLVGRDVYDGKSLHVGTVHWVQAKVMKQDRENCYSLYLYFLLLLTRIPV